MGVFGLANLGPEYGPAQPHFSPFSSDTRDDFGAMWLFYDVDTRKFYDSATRQWICGVNMEQPCPCEQRCPAHVMYDGLKKGQWGGQVWTEPLAETITTLSESTGTSVEDICKVIIPLIDTIMCIV